MTLVAFILGGLIGAVFGGVWVAIIYERGEPDEPQELS